MKSADITYSSKKVKTLVGELTLVANDKALVAVLWENDKSGRTRIKNHVTNNKHGVLVKAEAELKEYFAKRRKKFSVKTEFVGTEFQKKVWTALMTIPFGETRSYGDIAKAVGNPKAVRAVGAANGRNPISIIAPCHRVIATSGSLTGFAGGLENKKKLLDLESKKGR